MSKLATDRQIMYLNILLTRELGENNRKLYLDLFYNVNSSKKLTLLQASEIIEKFNQDNKERNNEISKAMEKILEKQGQKKLL